MEVLDEGKDIETALKEAERLIAAVMRNLNLAITLSK